MVVGIDKPFALVIEDERDIAALYRHILDVVGYRTEITLHSQDAIERLAHCQPDLVILDLNLPGIPGSQILERIRKEKRFFRTKVIVITAHAHIAAGVTVQPDLLLLKPVGIDQLRDLVSRIGLSQKASPLLQKPFDSSTDLYNQPFFVHRLDSALKQAREVDGNHFAIFLFSVNPKKGRNNSKADWEITLQQIATSLRSLLRPVDTLARFDPDTFYILIENVPTGEITTLIADRIQSRLLYHLPEVRDAIRLPIRIGILLCDRGYECTDQILADAKYAQSLALAQGDEYANYYYQFSVRK